MNDYYRVTLEILKSTNTHLYPCSSFFVRRIFYTKNLPKCKFTSFLFCYKHCFRCILSKKKKHFSFLSCEHIYFDHAVFVHKIFNTKKITVIYGFGCKKKDFSSLSCEHIYFYHAPDPTFIFPSLFLASTPHATSSYLTSFNVNLS